MDSRLLLPPPARSGLTVEVWAVYHGLKLMELKGTSSIEVETDASNVISLL